MATDTADYVDPYAERLAAQRALLAQAAPQMTAEQLAAVQQRQYENDRDFKIGMLAQLGAGGNEGMQNLGGTLVKSALAERQPHVTEAGAYNPQTGQWTENPNVTAQRNLAELNRLEDRSAAGRLQWQAARQATAERAAAAATADANRRDLHLALGLGGPGSDISGMVDALGTYKLDPSQAFARMAPAVRANLIGQVQAKYPDYDPTTYGAKKKAASDFTSGSQGNALRSFAVAGQHLDQLSGLADALNTGNVQLINKASNLYAQQTGNPAPTDFEAAKDVVSKEVIKAIVAGGGGVSERQELSQLMDAAKSPAQLKGVIRQYRNLMSAQHDALLEQRRAAGLPDSTMPNYGGGGTATDTQPTGTNFPLTRARQQGGAPANAPVKVTY